MRTFTLLIILLLLAACSPDGRFVFVTHTPAAQPTPPATAPSFATNTRTPTPLPSPTVGEPTPTEEGGFVIELVGWDNWNLRGPYNVTHAGDGRTVAIPAGWEYLYRPASGPGPEITPKPDGSPEWLEMSVAWRKGEFGFWRPVVFLEQYVRYVAIVRFAVLCYSISLCDMNAIDMRARIVSSGVTTELPPWGLRLGQNTALWVIESERPTPTIAFEAYVQMNPHMNFDGDVIWYSIELWRASPGYGSDAVVRF